MGSCPLAGGAVGMLRRGRVATVIQVSVLVCCGGVELVGFGALVCTPGNVAGGCGAVVVLVVGADVGLFGCTPGGATVDADWRW